MQQLIWLWLLICFLCININNENHMYFLFFIYVACFRCILYCMKTSTHSTAKQNWNTRLIINKFINCSFWIILAGKQLVTIFFLASINRTFPGRMELVSWTPFENSFRRSPDGFHHNHHHPGLDGSPTYTYISTRRLIIVTNPTNLRVYVGVACFERWIISVIKYFLITLFSNQGIFDHTAVNRVVRLHVSLQGIYYGTVCDPGKTQFENFTLLPKVRKPLPKGTAIKYSELYVT